MNLSIIGAATGNSKLKVPVLKRLYTAKIIARSYADLPERKCRPR